MKKNILLACAIMGTLVFSSCSTDPEDATSIHTYSPTENRPLDMSCGVKRQALSLEISEGDKNTYSIDLTKYENDFKDQLGMTVDQAIQKISTGEIAFKAINTTNNYWNGKPCNYNGTGWYFNASNRVDEQDNAYAIVNLDKEAKKLDVSLTDKAKEGALTLNVGFAKEENKYTKYVRFEIPITILGPSIVKLTLPMSKNDYEGYDIILADHNETFKTVLGLTSDEVIQGVCDGKVLFGVVGNDGNEYYGSYTADYNESEVYGYWMNMDSQRASWGDNSLAFADLWVADKDLYIGRYPGIAEGTYRINVQFTLASDRSKFVRFLLDLQM